jgi:hypothetical protein
VNGSNTAVYCDVNLRGATLLLTNSYTARFWIRTASAIVTRFQIASGNLGGNGNTLQFSDLAGSYNNSAVSNVVLQSSVAGDWSALARNGNWDATTFYTSNINGTNALTNVVINGNIAIRSYSPSLTLGQWDLASVTGNVSVVLFGPGLVNFVSSVVTSSVYQSGTITSRGLTINNSAMAVVSSFDMGYSTFILNGTDSSLLVTNVATVGFPSTATNMVLVRSPITIARTTSVTTLTAAGAGLGALTLRGAGTIRLGSAIQADTLTNSALFVTASNAVTATTLYSTNTITAGASTITVSNFTANTWAPGTSGVRLTDGGVFNATNAHNLAVVSGNVTLTNAPITCTGTIYSEAPSASLNLSGGTLTVTGQSLFSGVVSNGTIGASAPVTAERSQGVSGRINSIEQMGAE